MGFDDIVVHATILDARPYAGLRYWLQALDTQGRGWLDVAIADITEQFHCSSETVRRWLRDAREAQWFRRVVYLGRGQYRIWYASIFKIAGSLRLEKLGPTARVPLDRLYDGKRLATEVAAESLQASSRYQVRQEQPKGTRIPTAYDLLTSPSDSSAGALFLRHVGPRCAFVSGAFSFGVSQPRIALELGRSPSAIQRRLCNRDRARRALKPIFKKQVALGDRSAADWDFIASQANQTGDSELAREAQRHFYCFGRWEARTNLYVSFDVETTSKRRQKYNYNLSIADRRAREGLDSKSLSRKNTGNPKAIANTEKSVETEEEINSKNVALG